MTQYDWAALVCLLYLGWEIGCLRLRVKALEEQVSTCRQVLAQALVVLVEATEGPIIGKDYRSSKTSQPMLDSRCLDKRGAFAWEI